MQLPGRLSGLRIERIDTVALRVPLKRRYSGSAYSMVNRCTIITRLYTESGLVSEVYTGDTDDEQDVIVRIIHEELAPALRGASAADPEGCWQRMQPATYDILRDRGLALQAIACLDTAIWDVFGKAVDLPLFRLWGACREQLPLIVIGGYYGLDHGQIAELMRGYRAMGMAGCKFKVGGATPAEDAARVRAARTAAGDDFILLVDANQGYGRAEAVEFARRVGDLGIRWFEEPCRWFNDRRWMRDVRLATGMAVAAGQSEPTLHGVRDLIADGAVDVCNFDSSWGGGPTIWRKVAGLAAAFGVEMAHHEEPQVSAHLLASVPHGTYVECFDQDRDPIFWGLFANRPVSSTGMYTVPDRPGFGLALDADFVERYRVGERSTTISR
ncbi:MAG TPA: mandelate racemase/muconate lactonizing enzyme family protein [Chloroflexota bacterium]|nr:mandelate racemase/muconate lactonizing enzyme family protein [Chloroflexota bacterium]